MLMGGRKGPDELEVLRQKVAELEALVRHVSTSAPLATPEQSYRRFKLERYAARGYESVVALIEDEVVRHMQFFSRFVEKHGVAVAIADQLARAGCLQLIQAGIEDENRELAEERKKRKIRPPKPPK